MYEAAPAVIHLVSTKFQIIFLNKLRRLEVANNDSTFGNCSVFFMRKGIIDLKRKCDYN